MKKLSNNNKKPFCLKSIAVIFLSILLLKFFIVGNSYAIEGDKPGEGPPSIQTLTTFSTLQAATTSISETIKKFRTDTAPELDFYQPCNGGDNEIDFNINVKDVNISSVKSATLKLAVWDVDFTCSGGCCERDSVYINGHRLTTPTEYLTGADGQWSTVSFNVDPAWLVDGDNYIQIFIDLDCKTYWCVSCDWGELLIETEELDLSIESKNISISPKSWWEFWKIWKKPFTISAEIENTNDNDKTAEDVEVKFIKKNGSVIQSTTTKTISEIKAGESKKVEVNWNLDFSNEIEVIVDPNNNIDESNENNNKAKTTKITGTIKNSANTPLSHLLITYQEKDGTDWDDKVHVFSNGTGKYSIIKNMDSITEGKDGRINISLLHSPSDDKDDSVFRVIDETEWGNGKNPTSDDPVSKQSTQFTMEKNINQTVNFTVSDNEGGITYASLISIYNYHKNAGRAPADETLVQINDDDGGGPFMYGDTIHMQAQFNTATSCPSALAHEYMHVIEQGWDVAETYYGHDGIHSVEEGSAHWGSVKSRNTSIMVFPSSSSYTSFVNIDISNNNDTNGGGPAPSTSTGTREEMQIAGVMWDLNETHVWSVLENGGKSPTPDTPLQFYTYYKDLDSRTSPVIKNIFSAHNYQPHKDKWPGKDGKDPDYYTGNYSSELKDSNNDGKAEFLVIKVELYIDTPGNYYVFGEIEGLKYGASNFSYLEAGIQTVSLNFYGEQIFEAMLNGPYLFSSYLADENFNHVDLRQDAYSTLPYNYSDFTQPNLIFSGFSTDYGIDSNNDGLFDSLSIDVDVEVLVPGEYKFYATLLSGDDVIIHDQDNYVIVNLSKGINTITFNFDGKTIYAQGFSGPYTVATSIPRGTQIKTSEYSYKDFQTPGASLGQIISDSGVDENSDFLYDTLKVDLDINISLPGTYLITGHLYDNSNRHVTTKQTFLDLNSGSQNVALEFDGISIRNKGLDGPYILTIQLRDDEGNYLGQIEGVTSLYNHTEFQISDQNYFEIDFTDYGDDIDNNALYDFLTVELSLSSTIKQGVHRIDAFLKDQNDNLISFTNESVIISTTKKTVLLKFVGQNIWATKNHNGAYNLSLKIYDENMELLTAIENCHTSSSYDYIEFEPPQATFTDNYTDSIVDTNNDGLYEQLVVNVGTDINNAGSYSLEGVLFDINGVEITKANASFVLAQGDNSIQLIFDGEVIREHGVDGPYSVENLNLYYSDDTLADTREFVLSTKPYFYTDFQSPPVSLSGQYTDYGLDSNNDGIYDYLTVEVEVDTLNSGNYALNARLLDINKNEICWASTTSWLPASSVSIMVLNFNGEDIYKNGINGPYYLKDVYIYNMSNTTLSDTMDEAHITNSYNYWEFGNLIPVADAGGPYSEKIGTPIIFDASGSYDTDGTIISYEWDCDNDGVYDISTSQPTISYLYLNLYSGIVKLQITDNEGLSSTNTTFVEITEAHIPGDLDGDGDVDIDDINVIKAFANQPASANPDADIDGDGMITVMDARMLMMDCTLPRCARP